MYEYRLVYSLHKSRINVIALQLIHYEIVNFWSFHKFQYFSYNFKAAFNDLHYKL